MFAAYHDVRLPDVLNDSDDEATLHPAGCWQEMRRSHVDIRQPLSSPESLKIHGERFPIPMNLEAVTGGSATQEIQEKFKLKKVNFEKIIIGGEQSRLNA